MTSIWPATRYGEVTARLGERREAAADQATQAAETRMEGGRHRPHRYDPDGSCYGFCGVCGVNERVHGGGEL